LNHRISDSNHLSYRIRDNILRAAGHNNYRIHFQEKSRIGFCNNRNKNLPAAKINMPQHHLCFYI